VTTIHEQPALIPPVHLRAHRFLGVNPSAADPINIATVTSRFKELSFRWA